jgi:ssDNA-binding Zn-finger/Zn-ribbon topoisomerase 1
MRTSDQKRSTRIKLQCPNCRQEQLARISRRGFMRKHFYPMFGYYPWECAICRREYLVRKRGAAYRKVSVPSTPINDRAPSPEGTSSR